MYRLIVPLFIACGAFLSGCSSADRPALSTASDSLAFSITEAAGGLRAFNALPELAFSWSAANGDTVSFQAVHHWDRKGDRYRVEWPGGEDSVYVASFQPSAFDSEAPMGLATLNGTVLSGDELSAQLGSAYSRFINDSFWLLAPLKVLDPGAVRSLAPDSGPAVLHVAYEGVGLTPGDQYWMHTDADGAVTRWSYLLASGSTGTWDWTLPVDIPSARGALRLRTLKTNAAGRSIRIAPIAEAIPAGLFDDLTPRFQQ